MLDLFIYLHSTRWQNDDGRKGCQNFLFSIPLKGIRNDSDFNELQKCWHFCQSTI